ncbi:MAG: response regulator [Deltaproteobacteria bacterium]|nr:MAG: response regulator [Deltaproteobacteria bacterium]
MQGLEASGSGPGTGRRSSTILVVDDNADLRELVRELLLTAGHQVVEASDGAEALRLLRGGLRPRMILLDRNTPILDGPLLLREAADLLSDIAVVWMTGEDRDVAHPSVVATLHKPFAVEELARTVEDALLNGHAQDALFP